MEQQTVTHTTINGKYHISLERGATKGVIGYKVSVNSDSIPGAMSDIEVLKTAAEKIAVEPEAKPVLEDRACWKCAGTGRTTDPRTGQGSVNCSECGGTGKVK